MIRIANLTKRFGEKTVFSGLNLELASPGFYALLGPSGSGKTTLLRILSGLDRNFEGDASVEGTVSYVFQEDRLIPSLTAFENVFLVCGDRERSCRLLEMTGLSGDPSGKENDWNKYPEELSGGMNRRVALARALAFPHDVLLLDEPFSALDPETKAKVVRLVSEEEKGKLLLLVTHDESEAASLGCELLGLDSSAE